MSTLRTNALQTLDSLYTVQVKDLVGSAVLQVTNLTALRALSKSGVKRAQTAGYYTAGDGGNQDYMLDVADTSSPETPGLVVVASDGGRWKPLNPPPLNPKKFGAKGDGVADDTAAIQATINYGKSIGGGTVRLGAGNWRITAPLVFDYTDAYYATNSVGRKVNLKGDGSVNTIIKADAGAYNALAFIGHPNNNVMYLDLEGIHLTGVTTVGSTGVYIIRGAFIQLKDVVVEQFGTALNGIDLEHVSFSDCLFRFNTVGVTGSTGTLSSPNSWSLYNTTISNNSKSGLYLSNGNALNWNGGSCQYNGRIGGGSDNFGVQLVELGNGYGTAGFTNMVFEGNGGLGDFVSGQSTYPCNVSFDNVSFFRTVGFSSATVTGAANNGSGAIRLTVNSTAALVGNPRIAVWGVGGTVEANNATPWNFTVVDATHVDLVGSSFSNAYTSGGAVSIVGFGTNNILADGVAGSCVYAISNCTFRIGAGYIATAARPSIALANVNAKIYDDGSNFFQSATEKLTYPAAQQIGDDNSLWISSFTPVVSAGGGTFTGTATCRYKKVGKTVHFAIFVTATSYAATPVAPLTVTLPFAAVTAVACPVFNTTATTNSTGIISAGFSNVRVWKDATFPIGANGQTVAISGTYETP